jgi:MHS family proline/betaine transporter-like MFS transporter
MKENIKMRENNNKVTFLLSLGSGFEYYDFIIFALMSGTLSQLFFEQANSELINMMNVYMVFAIGYVARPFGGIVFAAIGDKEGRKKSFMLIVVLMAMSSLFIGFLPTYEVIGRTAPLILIILRVVQGISFGAELPGAITIVAECSDKNKRAKHTSFIISGVSLGSVMATGVSYFLNKLLSPAQILDWGWRIPFILGGLLAIVNYFIRREINETPEFIKNKKIFSHQNYISPIVFLFKNYSVNVCIGIFLTAGTGILIITNLFFPVYIHKMFGYEKAEIFSAITWGVLWCAFIIPTLGKRADKKGPFSIYKLGAISAFLLLLPMMNLLKQGEYALLILFFILYQTIVAALMAGYMPTMVRLFPTTVRQTGISFCYNITYALMGLIPSFYMYMGALENMYVIIYCISGVSALSILSIYAVEKLKLF